MSTPTPEQIATVKVNVNNLMDLTNFVHQYAIDKINNAYLLQSQPQNDAGQAWADALIGGSIWVLGDFGFPGANFCAGILSGVFDMYTTNTPPNLQGAFAAIWQRFDATFLQANTDLSAIYGDPVSHWNDTFTGVDNNPYLVSDLAFASMPGKDEPTFVSAAEGILTAFDYNLWKETLKAGWYQWEGDTDPMLFSDEDQNWDAAGWGRSFVQQHPAYYIKWKWTDNHSSSCCSEEKGWDIWEIWLGQHAGPFTDAAAPQNLCDYLFKDDGGGTVVNPSAITTRADVFSNFGLTCKTYFVNTGGGGGPMLSTRRALVDFKHRPGKTFQELLEQEPRPALEAKVQKAAEDPQVAYELQKRPRETLFKILGLKIPDHISVNVIAEKPDQFFFVLPKVK
jgi:hypothetical protein